MENRKQFDLARKIAFALIGAGHMDTKHFTKAAILISNEMTAHRNESGLGERGEDEETRSGAPQRA